MVWNEKLPALVYWLSVIYLLYLLALPMLANFTIVPLLEDNPLKIACWFYYGFIGIPLAYIAMVFLYPFPKDIVANHRLNKTVSGRPFNENEFIWLFLLTPAFWGVSWFMIA